MGLEVYREKVSACDRKLMEILKERMEVCSRIGEYKKEHDLPVIQSDRYQKLMDMWANEAVEYGLDRDFACQLFELIHGESVRIQNDIEKGER